jgi:hypothetical protein
MEIPALPAPSRIKIVLTDIAGSPILPRKGLLIMRGGVIKNAK